MKSTFTLLVLLTATLSFAQPVLTAENNAPQVGESFSFNLGTYVTPSAGGANVTWDFSNQPSQASGTFSYSSISESPYAGVMLTGEILETCDICASQNVITTASGSRGVVGFIYPAANFAMYFWGGRVDFPYPLNYLDSETNWTYNGQTTVSGVPLLFEGSVDMDADGYGTLVLPWGSIPNVIRVHRVIFEERFNSGQAGYVEMEYYEYYTPGISFPLIRQYQERNVTSTGGFIDVAQEYLMWLNPLSTGCTNPDACNFDALAAIDDGSCIIIGSSCDDGLSETVNDIIGEDCMCAGEVVMLAGCTMPDACNYNMTATVDDGSCFFVGEPCDDGDPQTMNDVYTVDCLCAGEVQMVSGCTNADACNFNSLANLDDGTCYFVGDNCDDGDSLTVSDVYNALCECEGALGLKEVHRTINIFPNPASSFIWIEADAMPEKIEIYDLSGRLVHTTNRSKRMDVSDCSAGLYVMRITIDGLVSTHQLEIK